MRLRANTSAATNESIIPTIDQVVCADVAEAEPSSHARPALSTCKREIIELCADAVQELGLARSVGQIFGLIYVSPAPLTFTDVLAHLELSKGSVSQGLKFLREFGAIKVEECPGDRSEHYTAETELRRLLGGLLQTRLRRPLETGADRLSSIWEHLSASTEPDREFLEQRLGSLQAWHRKALFALPLIQRFLGSDRLG